MRGLDPLNANPIVQAQVSVGRVSDLLSLDGDEKPSTLRALTCPVVSLNRPSLARIGQDNATFLIEAALLR